MSRDVVFIAPPTGTYTPTNSGALATYIHEIALVAASQGFSPTIVARQAPRHIAPYTDFPAHFLPFEEPKAGTLAYRWGRLERKITGWRHVGQRAYLGKLARLLEREKLLDAPLFLHNDPDAVVFLRERYPEARLVHIFHNQMEAKLAMRRRYSEAHVPTIGISNFTRHWIEEHYSVPVSTVYNGVNLNDFSPAKREPDGVPFINFVGRTGIEKAPDTFLKAALLLAQTRRDFGVQLVGSNHWGEGTEDGFQKLLRELGEGIRERGVELRTTGHVGRGRIADEFRRAHIHIVPSRWDEPFGLTTLEGMACGLATIASKTGGSPEVIGDGGLLFERDQESELARHIARWLDAPQERREFAHRARERAAFFTWERTWQGLHQCATNAY